MRKIRALAPSKVNLTFDIIGMRPDSFHDVKTLMQTVDLRDDITIALEPSQAFSVNIVCTNEVLPRAFPLDDSNLMVKAARLFLSEVVKDENSAITIQIEKNIPVGAGLAGGSSDAAAVLVALNELTGSMLTSDQLCALGAKVGSDVPFCIVGGTRVGTQRGDSLADIFEGISQPDFSYCLVKPRKLSIATPWAYQQFDRYKGQILRPNLAKAVQALHNGSIEPAVKSFGNVFEPIVFSAYPELQEIKSQLLELGCWCCHLSGSGPTLFAIVADREQAHAIRRKMLKTDDLEFDYVRLSTPDLGSPLEFYIAQSCTTGVQLSPASS